MSSSNVSLPTYQAPSFTEASGVMGRIQTEIGNINNIFAEVAAIMRELQALQPPDQSAFMKDGTDKDGKAIKVLDTERFNQAMATFQAQVSALNSRLESTYRKLGEAQLKLQRLQGQDLPAAQRRDVEKMQKAMKDALETLNGAAKAIQESAGKGEVEGTSSSREETRIELRVREKKVELHLASEPTLKQAIQAFQLMVVVVGMSEPARKFNSMPAPAGGGLPPINTP